MSTVAAAKDTPMNDTQPHDQSAQLHRLADERWAAFRATGQSVPLDKARNLIMQRLRRADHARALDQTIDQ